jgi:hypothetical protein
MALRPNHATGNPVGFWRRGPEAFGGKGRWDVPDGIARIV